jgi:NADH-quinone oxidoreductase subunit L
VGVVTAFLTAFYIFRLIYTVFHGESRVEPKAMKHLHESPAVITIPLIVLAILSVTVGWAGLPIHGFNGIEAILGPVLSPEEHAEAASPLLVPLMLISVVVALAGWMTARYFYLTRPELPVRLSERFAVLYRFSLNKWYVDELYNRLFVQPTVRMANGLWRGVDVRMIDGAVNGVASMTLAWSDRLRRIQSGQLQHYALLMALGAFIMLTVYLLR